MKYCKKCGVLYTTEVCPKCGVIEPEEHNAQPPVSVHEMRKRWITLGIAIPASILLIIGVITLYFKIMH